MAALTSETPLRNRTTSLSPILPRMKAASAIVSVRVTLISLFRVTHSGLYAEMIAIRGVESICSAPDAQVVKWISRRSKVGTNLTVFRLFKVQEESFMKALQIGTS
jgi:hypothetical protein